MALAGAEECHAHSHARALPGGFVDPGAVRDNRVQVFVETAAVVVALLGTPILVGGSHVLRENGIEVGERDDSHPTDRRGRCSGDRNPPEHHVLVRRHDVAHRHGQAFTGAGESRNDLVGVVVGETLVPGEVPQPLELPRL
jgi:hypothetical protein